METAREMNLRREQDYPQQDLRIQSVNDFPWSDKEKRSIGELMLKVRDTIGDILYDLSK